MYAGEGGRERGRERERERERGSPPHHDLHIQSREFFCCVSLGLSVDDLDETRRNETRAREEREEREEKEEREVREVRKVRE